MNHDNDNRIDRRELGRTALRWLAACGIGGGAAALCMRGGNGASSQACQRAECGGCAARADCALPQAMAAGYGHPQQFLWQIDPDKCMACGNCQTACVLDVSAVKAVNCFALCGYCDVCTGYFPTKDFTLDTGAENQLCPTGAIARKFVEEKGGERFFEYTIDESLCIACGKCVVGCRLMNGSLYLQIRHDRCQNCNECAIAVACPTQAIERVPVDSPYLLSKAAAESEQSLARKREETAKRKGADKPSTGADAS